MAPLSFCTCLFFIGHKLYHKCIPSSTCPLFPAVFALSDSHIIVHILFHREIFHIKLLNCAFITDIDLGKLCCPVAHKGQIQATSKLDCQCARGCSEVSQFPHRWSRRVVEVLCHPCAHPDVLGCLSWHETPVFRHLNRALSICYADLPAK